MMSSSDDENSATADRVEKKSIDEAIASFAMLVRIECVFILYACRVLLCASERRGGLGNRFFLLLLRLLLLLLRINALVTKFSDLFLCALSLSVLRVNLFMVKKYRRRRLCSARASSSRS